MRFEIIFDLAAAADGVARVVFFLDRIAWIEPGLFGEVDDDFFLDQLHIDRFIGDFA